ncbi:VOC family protein [Solimicrobium silvestre]|uniref:Glyoxalase-like domain n=1 Tax=Solimicrobium silvestre TaxID=2099400 RepID=A0A2S9H469_9BURK|nr:VOC family protein [Solimicrobium silvestre]PRC94751.1 Glyoxalase-like domain [Solimicrobium silvestre]
MFNPNFILLYVANPLASADFYAKLLGKPAIEKSPTFAMFALESGVKLGLWAKHTVEPAVTASQGGSELAFAVANNDIVTAQHNDWKERGLVIAQTPTAMDFGYTFVALDPDGNRLRVFAPSAP